MPLPDLRNLDIYQEIGPGLDLEKIARLSDEAYFALYQEKLAEWHGCYPVAPGARLWRDTRPKPQALGDRRAVA